MEPSIYSYSLCIALPLMLFFGFYFLLAPTPEKAIFNNYLRSRRIMGVAILLLAANYSVHFFFGIRFKKQLKPIHLLPRFSSLKKKKNIDNRICKKQIYKEIKETENNEESESIFQYFE